MWRKVTSRGLQVFVAGALAVKGFGAWVGFAYKTVCRKRRSQIQVRETPSVFHPRAQRNAFRRRRCGQHCSLNRRRQIALSNSKNAVSFLSACTTKRFPLLRIALEMFLIAGWQMIRHNQ